jgi:ubiquitin conjugation factor E4 B
LFFHAALSRYAAQKEKAEKSAWEIVWLKHLAEELQSENSGMLIGLIFYGVFLSCYVEDSQSALSLNVDIIDRLLIARLELDPQSMS